MAAQDAATAVDALLAVTQSVHGSYVALHGARSWWKCMDRQATHVYVPCGHALCGTCAADLRQRQLEAWHSAQDFVLRCELCTCVVAFAPR